MIKGDHKKLEEITQHNICAEHKKPLGVAWVAGEDCWAIRCPEGHYPDAVTRVMSFDREVKVGKHEDVAKAVKVRQKHEALEKGGSNRPTAMTFAGVTATDLGTDELLTPDQLKFLVDYARRYDLDPVRSHVVMMYSKPYITIDGYLFHANRQNISYKLQSRPLGALERPDYNIPDGDHAWLAEVIMDDGESTFTGLGIVTREEIIEKSKRKPDQLRSPVVAKHPQLLAQKRAEWQALRRAFPIGEEVNKNEE